MDNIRLFYDNVTRTTSNNDGVDLRIPGFGDPFYVEWIDPSMASSGSYFKDIGNALSSLGYKRNVSIRGAPYDFRKAPSKSLKIIINRDKKTVSYYTYTRITFLEIICHIAFVPC